MGVTPIDICQQCISRAMLMEKLVTLPVLKSKKPLVLKFHLGVRLKLLLNEMLELMLVV